MPEIKEIPHITLYNFAESIVSKPKCCPKDKYFLFFGRLSYEKGVITLLKAVKDIPGCKLKIVGTGPKENELKEFTMTYKMNNVEFLGYKKGTELTELVSNAYCVVIPSEWYENNPMTIIESYSVGTPVIGAKIGGIPEIIINGQTGFLFESGNFDDLKNKIQIAMKLSQDEYKALSEGAIKFARDYLSIDRYMPKLISFYEQFIK